MPAPLLSTFDVWPTSLMQHFTFKPVEYACFLVTHQHVVTCLKNLPVMLPTKYTREQEVQPRFAPVCISDQFPCEDVKISPAPKWWCSSSFPIETKKRVASLKQHERSVAFLSAASPLFRWRRSCEVKGWMRRRGGAWRRRRR